MFAVQVPALPESLTPHKSYLEPEASSLVLSRSDYAGSASQHSVYMNVAP
jgi:hypothetical protein